MRRSIRRSCSGSGEVLADDTHDPAIEQTAMVKSERCRRARRTGWPACVFLPDYAKIGYGHYTYNEESADERDLFV